MITFIAIIICITLASVNADARIVGGQVAKVGQFPFIAGIEVSTTTGLIFCSGTLISAHYILTSAQCVENAYYFEVILGVRKITKKKFKQNEITFVYPDIKFRDYPYDVVLLKFDEPIEISKGIKPIDIVAGFNLSSSSSVIAIGWGQTHQNSTDIADSVHFVKLKTIKNEVCQNTYGNQINEHMVCTIGSGNHEGICFGDTGGPLVIYKKRKFYHVGIASFISGNGCENNDPSVFFRTSYYADWINEVINQDSITS